jgi:hypothetical protein
MPREFDTTDGYAEASSLRLVVPGKRLTFTVQNNGVTAQFATVTESLHAGAANYNTSEFPFIPGVWEVDSGDFGDALIAGVQFRSSVAGAPGHVIVLAQ